MFGSISSPNSTTGWERVRVSELPVMTPTIRGVALSVLGGDPQLLKVVGTVAAVTALENVTVSWESESVVVVVKSPGIDADRFVVPAT
jgi:hypothetical protein